MLTFFEPEEAYGLLETMKPGDSEELCEEEENGKKTAIYLMKDDDGEPQLSVERGGCIVHSTNGELKNADDTALAIYELIKEYFTDDYDEFEEFLKGDGADEDKRIQDLDNPGKTVSYTAALADSDDREQEIGDAFDELIGVLGCEKLLTAEEVEEFKESVMLMIFQKYNVSLYRPTILENDVGEEAYTKFPYDVISKKYFEENI